MKKCGLCTRDILDESFLSHLGIKFDTPRGPFEVVEMDAHLSCLFEMHRNIKDAIAKTQDALLTELTTFDVDKES